MGMGLDILCTHEEDIMSTRCLGQGETFQRIQKVCVEHRPRVFGEMSPHIIPGARGQEEDVKGHRDKAPHLADEELLFGMGLGK